MNNDGSIVNETHIARVTPDAEEDCDAKKVPPNETKFALMANLYVSEGARGQVCRSLPVICSKMTLSLVYRRCCV